MVHVAFQPHLKFIWNSITPLKCSAGNEAKWTQAQSASIHFPQHTHTSSLSETNAACFWALPQQVNKCSVSTPLSVYLHIKWLQYHGHRIFWRGRCTPSMPTAIYLTGALDDTRWRKRSVNFTNLPIRFGEVYKWNVWPEGGGRGKVRRSPSSLELILCGPCIPIPNLIVL